jgi:hypothetical protein
MSPLLEEETSEVSLEVTKTLAPKRFRFFSRARSLTPCASPSTVAQGGVLEGLVIGDQDTSASLEVTKTLAPKCIKFPHDKSRDQGTYI